MTDDVGTGTASEPLDRAPTSFGARLAAAREKEGLSVGEMAARLRLHVNQVRALEGENLDKLPETAYVRGFVRSYARSLGLDPAPLVEDLNSKVAAPDNSVVDGMARARDYSPVRAATRERASRTAVLGLSVVALVALGAIGWYATRQSAQESPVAASAPAPQAAAGPQAQAPAAEPAAATAEAQQPPVAEPAPAPSQPLTDAGALLVLSFSGSSWVEVTDATGKVLVSQTAGAGEILQPVGTPPLSVVIGDAAKATAKVRGEPYNLEPATRANIARFTVK